jgi:hypothetical protein
MDFRPTDFSVAAHRLVASLSLAALCGSLAAAPATPAGPAARTAPATSR